MKTMHTTLLRFALGTLLVVLCQACVREEEPHDDTSSRGNFEALWTIIDEHYCFFGYKQIDWDSVHAAFAPRITDRMTKAQLFEVLCDMLATLRDGHVNLSRAADMGRYWAWRDDYPLNFDAELQEAYLGRDYKIAGGLNYCILDDNIGYITCRSFSSGFGDSNLDEIMRYLRLCNGIIIDVRNNGGGLLTYAELLAGRLTNERPLVGYITHKTGRGHDDFAEPQPEYLDPSDGLRWQKRAIILTNRRCYSATNTFVRDVKGLPRVTILGDTTGGGSGMPFSSELPNGWAVRFSAVPMYDAQMQHIEFGISPDVVCQLDSADMTRGHDTLIETARQMLSAAP